MSQTNRKEQLAEWLSTIIASEKICLQAMTGDAGFRQYYRVNDQHGKSFIAVDSPNDKCNNAAFIAIQQAFKQQEVLVPEIVGFDDAQGFFCLSDLGDTLLSDQLTMENMTRYYQQAIDIIPLMAKAKIGNTYRLPLFDQAFVQMELSIFNDWLLEKYLNIKLSELENKKLQHCFDFLIKHILEQPQGMMHRDFHSRNIMVTDNEELAVIDFQDTVIGPVTYDIVSLLRDCYVKWPQQKIEPLLAFFVKLYQNTHQAESDNQLYPIAVWQRWFDLTGLQRHVKVAGIFARLYLRDGKPGYLGDIPLTLKYIAQVSANYDELDYLHTLVTDRVIPAYERQIK